MEDGSTLSKDFDLFGILTGGVPIERLYLSEMTTIPLLEISQYSGIRAPNLMNDFAVDESRFS